MDFLKNHFEKVILGFMLFGVLISCGFLLKALADAEKTVTGVEQQATRSLSVGGRLESIREKDLDAPAELTDPKVALNICDEKCGLLQPKNYIICINRECLNLLDFETRICKYCQTEQPPADVDVQEGEDLDGDGITDYFERQYAFLDPNDPSDARQDYDGDSFLNIEEFTAKTRMDDPTSIPPLAKNLRCMKLFRKPIPIVLSGITTYNSSEPERWDVGVIIHRGGRSSKSLVRIGGDIGDTGYKLTKGQHRTVERKNPRTNLMETVDVSSVVIQDKQTGKEYTLKAGETTYEEDLIAQFLFLTNRYDPRRCRPLYAKVGTEFPLIHAGAKVRERYVVLELKEKTQGGSEQVVKIKRLRVQKEAEDQEDQDEQDVFDIPSLSRDDFIKPDRSRNNRQAGPGGAPQQAPMGYNRR